MLEVVLAPIVHRTLSVLSSLLSGSLVNGSFEWHWITLDASWLWGSDNIKVADLDLKETSRNNMIDFLTVRNFYYNFHCTSDRLSTALDVIVLPRETCTCLFHKEVIDGNGKEKDIGTFTILSYCHTEAVFCMRCFVSGGQLCLTPPSLRV